MSSLTADNDNLYVKLTFDANFGDNKEKVKAIPGRRWDDANKAWVLPKDAAIADRVIRSIRPEDVDEDIITWIRTSKTSNEEALTSPLPEDAELLVPWATMRADWQPEVVNDEKVNGLLPYQRAAVDAMATNSRMLLCDDMGLGKTLQSISAVEEFKLRNDLPDGPKLVIAPASVLGSWDRELRRWLHDPEVVIVNATTPAKRKAQIEEGVKNNAWIIVNWEQLRVKKVKVKKKNGGSKTVTEMKEPLFQTTEWLAVIADEIHRAKNRSAQQSQGLHRVEGKAMFGLTGTPMLNSPDELWSPLRWLWPDEYHESGARRNPGAIAFWPFYNLYVDDWEDAYGHKVVTGVKNPDALRYALKDKLIRRLAPAGGRKRIYESVPLTKSQQKLYDEAQTSMWLMISEEVSAGNEDAIRFAKAAAEGATPYELMQIPNGAARFVRLQQIIENAALLGGPDESGVMDDFEQKFEDSQPNQWLVFCKYKQSCEILAERLRKKFGAEVAVYNGDTSTQERTEIENRYQAGQIDVIVGTIAAMNTGITLTSGHLQYWLSRDVVPANNEQGEARQDRLGQQHLVIVYIPQAEGTVAAGSVFRTNKIKEGIIKTVLPQLDIQETRV